MKRCLALIVFALTAFGSLAHAQAADRTTPDEAKALALRAADLVRTVGVEKARPQFEDKNGPWFGRGDTYVFVYGTDGMVYAHGGMPSLDGQNLIDLKDPSGKSLMREICGVQGEEWVNYVWQNPSTKRVEKKTSYVIRVGNQVVGAGAYID